jgi:hypothetical protein
VRVHRVLTENGAFFTAHMCPLSRASKLFSTLFPSNYTALACCSLIAIGKDWQELSRIIDIWLSIAAYCPKPLIPVWPLALPQFDPRSPPQRCTLPIWICEDCSRRVCTRRPLLHGFMANEWSLACRRFTEKLRSRSRRRIGNSHPNARNCCVDSYNPQLVVL